MKRLVLLFVCSIAAAQQSNVQKEVRFTPIDKKGQIVSIAPGSQLSATVNDKYPSTPFEVRSSGDLPLRVGLVVDTSNSVEHTRVDSIVGGATRFLSARLKNGDAALMVSVKAEIELVQDWTDEGRLLTESVQKLRAGGGTALFDGIYFACKKMAAEPTPFRKAVIVTSDGDDNQSHALLTEAEKLCHDNGVTVNTINYKGSDDALGRGSRVLEHLARTTDGLYFAPNSDKEIRLALDQLNAYWAAEYRGTATFVSLPEEKKIKNVFVTPLMPTTPQKFRGSLFSLAQK